MNADDIPRGPGFLRLTPSAAPAIEFQFQPVPAPSLEGLAVEVPTPEDLSEDDLLQRFHALKRSVSPRRKRAADEPTALTDEVVFDALGYCEGKLIPFSARFDVQMELAPVPAMPGFSEGLAGTPVGQSVELALTLPADYPVESLAGKPVRFLVDLKSAEAVDTLDDDAPALLEKLGRGDTLDAVMDSLREELEDEAADQLRLEGRELVFDALLARANPSVRSEVVDEEIRRCWQRLEGEALARKNFDADEQAEALAGWLADADTRTQAERRLRLAIVLGSIVQAQKLTLDAAQLESLLADAAEGAGLGLTAAQLHEGLRGSKPMTAQLYNVGLHLLAVEHVLKHAQIRYQGA